MPQLNFRGKPFVQNLHFTVPYHELIPQKDKSLTDKVSLHDNLIVHGDNLLALKALLPTYAGKVKCIYIDPPYNTGNEGWAYNDNVNSPIMKEWLGKTVDREDLTRHDKWLCMMTPRLKLLREMLRDDGVIFISIDDNEVHHLSMLMDEIFGEENFVADIVWDLGTGTTAGHFTRSHEYIVMYAKNRSAVSNFNNPLTDEMIAHGALKTYSRRNPESEIIFPAGIEFEGKDAVFIGTIGGSEKETIISEPDEGMRFENGRLIKPVRILAAWAMRNQILSWLEGKETFDSKGQKIKRFYFNKSGILWYEKDKTIVNPPSVIRQLTNTKQGTNEQEEIFGDVLFDFPKPSKLISFLLRFITEKDSIILDSFAGSGTTAHAVLALNKEDGGNRKFAMIEMENYADNLTAERVRRIIKGIPASKNEALKNGLGGTFSFFELGKSIEVDSILSGQNLPSYNELARYVFFTATGEEFDESQVDEKTNSIGESKEYQVYLLYKPDVEYLRKTALTLDFVEQMPASNGKKRLVFAPTKYLDQNQLDEHRVIFAQLPFEIYQLTK